MRTWYLSRVADQSIVANPLEGADRIVARRGEGYAWIYSPAGPQVQGQHG